RIAVLVAHWGIESANSANTSDVIASGILRSQLSSNSVTLSFFCHHSNARAGSDSNQFQCARNWRSRRLGKSAGNASASAAAAAGSNRDHHSYVQNSSVSEPIAAINKL